MYIDYLCEQYRKREQNRTSKPAIPIPCHFEDPQYYGTIHSEKKYFGYYMSYFFLGVVPKSFGQSTRYHPRVKFFLIVD